MIANIEDEQQPVKGQDPLDLKCSLWRVGGSRSVDVWIGNGNGQGPIVQFPSDKFMEIRIYYLLI